MKHSDILKKLLIPALILLTLSLSISVSAAEHASGTCGENLTWTLSADGVMTISGTGEMYDYKNNEQPWTGYDTLIRKVVLEDTVERIGKYAFYYCNYLTEAVLGTGTTSIGDFAFNSCPALQTLTVGDDTSAVGSCFFNTNITTVILRDSVTALNSNIRNLDTIEVFVADNSDGIGYFTRDSVLYLKEKKGDTFVTTIVKQPEATKLTGTFTVPDDVTVIGEHAFRGQSLLEEVILPRGVTSLDLQSFYNCESLRRVTLGDATETVPTTFAGTTALSTLVLRNSVTYLDTDLRDDGSLTAFEVDDTDGMGYYDVNGVLYHYAENDGVVTKTLVRYPHGRTDTSCTVEAGVSVIGEHAFYDCASLQTVYLPESVEALSAYAFYSCDSLTGIYFKGKPPVLKKTNALPSGTLAENLILYYIEGTEGWENPWNGYTALPFPENTETKPPKGDANEDGVLDKNDADGFSNAYAGIEGRCRLYQEYILNGGDYDFNNDGKFNRKDIMILMRFLAGWEGYEKYFQ